MMVKIDLVLSRAGMAAHAWIICNPTGKEMPAITRTSADISNYEKILGYCWNKEYDAFHQIVLFEETPLSWDSELCPDSSCIFPEALERFTMIEGIMWPRAMVPTLGYKVTENSPMLVHSGDGSEVGMCSVTHLVTELNDNDPAKKNGIVNHVAFVKATKAFLFLASS